MDKNNDIDELSRSLIEPYKMDPPDHAWNSMEAELVSKQAVIYHQRANRFKRLAVGLALLLIAFIAYHYLSYSPESNQLTWNPNIILSTDSVRSNRSESSDKENSQEQLLQKNHIRGSDSFQFNKRPQYLDSSEENKAASTISNSKPAKQNSPNPLATNEIKAKINKIDKIINDNIIETNDENDENIRISDYKKESICRLLIKSSNLVKENFVKNNDSIRKEVAQTNAFLLITPDNSGEEIAYRKNLTELPLAGEDSSINYSENQSGFNNGVNKKSRWSIASFYSPNFTWNHYKENSPEYGASETEYFKSETPEFSYSTGLLLNRTLTHRWSISFGCYYSTIAYSMSFPTIYAKYGTDNELHYEYPTSFGTIEMPTPSGIVLHEGDSLNINASCAQQIKLINVPLTAMFRITKSKLTWYANAGVTANFLVHENAKMRTETNEIKIVNKIEGLKKINYGFLLGTGLQYNLSEHVGIFLEPVLRGSITSMTKNSSVNSYPYSLGLKGGISFTFNY